MYIEKNKLEWPVSLNLAKTHLRREIDFIEDDDYINHLIKSSTYSIEQMVNFDIAYTKNSIEIDDFIGDTVTINEGNFKSLITIKDANDISLGYVDVLTPKLLIPHKFTIELTESLETDPLCVEFYTGWEQDNVLNPLAQAILMKIKDLYTYERGSYSFNNYKYNEAIERLVRPYIIHYV